MDIKLKEDILRSLHNVYLKHKDDTDLQNFDDIFNLVKVIENYEEFIPNIRAMLNEKAKRDKWKLKSDEWQNKHNNFKEK